MFMNYQLTIHSYNKTQLRKTTSYDMAKSIAKKLFYDNAVQNIVITNLETGKQETLYR